MVRKIFLLMLLGSVLVISCDGARFPIEEAPTVKVDTHLLGVWKVNDREYRNASYEIRKLNEYEFEMKVLDTTNQVPYTLALMCNSLIFLSKVNDYTFLNVAAVHDSSTTYSFIRLLSLDARGGKMSLATFSDTMLSDLNNAAEIKLFIEGHADEPSFYSDTVNLCRVR